MIGRVGIAFIGTNVFNVLTSIAEGTPTAFENVPIVHD